MHQLHEFRNFNVDGSDIDELVALSLFGRQLRAEYEALQLEEPEWVGIQTKALRREIHSRSKELLEARDREISSRLDALKSPGEKREELIKEQEKIRQKLAVGA